MNEQYHSKFETVRTQMLNQKNKFLLFFSLLSHICLSPVCLYLPLNSSLSSLPISASLSLSLSSSLTSRKSLPTANLAMVSTLLKTTHLATVSLALYMFIDFN